MKNKYITERLNYILKVLDGDQALHIISFLIDHLISLHKDRDCDEDAHKCNTSCRCCEAKQILDILKKHNYVEIGKL